MSGLATQKRDALVDKVDETIESVCEKVKKNDLCPGEYADTVKALAALVEARAKLNVFENNYTKYMRATGKSPLGI